MDEEKKDTIALVALVSLGVILMLVLLALAVGPTNDEMTLDGVRKKPRARLLRAAGLKSSGMNPRRRGHRCELNAASGSAKPSFGG
jgi:hypothetical protein